MLTKLLGWLIFILFVVLVVVGASLAVYGVADPIRELSIAKSQLAQLETKLSEATTKVKLLQQQAVEEDWLLQTTWQPYLSEQWQDVSAQRQFLANLADWQKLTERQNAEAQAWKNILAARIAYGDKNYTVAKKLLAQGLADLLNLTNGKPVNIPNLPESLLALVVKEYKYVHQVKGENVEWQIEKK